MCTCNRDDHNLERIGKKCHFKNLGQLHKEWIEAGPSTLRAPTHRHSTPNIRPLLNESDVRNTLPGWRRKRTGVLLCGHLILHFHLEAMFFITFKVKTTTYKEILQHAYFFVLPFTGKLYGDTDLLQDISPVTVAKLLPNDFLTMRLLFLIGQPTCLTRNLYRNYGGLASRIWEENMKPKAAIKARSMPFCIGPVIRGIGVPNK